MDIEESSNSWVKYEAAQCFQCQTHNPSTKTHSCKSWLPQSDFFTRQLCLKCMVYLNKVSRALWDAKFAGQPITSYKLKTLIQWCKLARWKQQEANAPPIYFLPKNSCFWLMSWRGAHKKNWMGGVKLCMYIKDWFTPIFPLFLT